MDIEQNFSQSEQVSQDSFDVFEDKQAQAVFSAFFGDCSEEEQLILREFGSKFNIRANDALWAIAGVFVFFGRFCNKLPLKVKSAVDEGQHEAIETIKQVAASIAQLETAKAQSTLSQTLEQISRDIINQNRKRMWLYDFFLPLACSCLGVFCLCLISFVGGAAVAGKGWGHSPLEALLNAPAGWIIPLALIPVGGFALFRGLTDQGRARFVNLIIAGISAATVLCVLPHIL